MQIWPHAKDTRLMSLTLLLLNRFRPKEGSQMGTITSSDAAKAVVRRECHGYI